MSLVHEIYEFFNEARPRTKNVGVEDIPRPGSGKQQRDPDLYGKEKKVSSRIDVNPEGLKSEYQAGSVHEIRFNNVTKGVTQKVYTIYRNLSESDYKTLKAIISPKVVTFVTPSSEPAHELDVYYITIPKMKYGERKGADYTYFVYLKKDAADSLSAEQKSKIKLTLVPIKDIADGLSKRPLDLYTLMSFLTDEQKKRVKREKPSSAPKKTIKSKNDEDFLDIELGFLADIEDEEPELDTDKPAEEEPESVKAAKKKAAVFMLDDKVERTFTQIIKNYDISATPTATAAEKKEAKDKLSELMKRFMDLLFDMTDDELERKAVIDYSVGQKLDKKPGLYKLIKLAYENMESIKETLNEASTIKDETIYNASVKYDSGKSRDAKIDGKSLKKLIGDQEFVYNKDIPFERVIDDPTRGMVTVKGTVKVAPPEGAKLKLIGRRTPEGEPITYDPAAKEPEEKEKVPSRSFKTSISGQGVRSYKVPVNMGVKMADVKPSDLAYKYYIIAVDTKEMVHGTNDWAEAKEKAKELGDKFRAVQKAALPALGVKISEALSPEEKQTLNNYRVSFTIQSDLDPDKQYNISDNVKEIKDEQNKFILVLKEAGILTFDKSGTASFKYSKDNKDYQALNIPDDLSKLVKKSFEPAKPEEKVDSKLEAYIRKRIQQAIKEAEVSQYWGYQGKDVKKKRLEEYMKKYEWGFQDSDNPHTRAIGSEIHSIVNKLVHELGDEGVGMFNSYAPKGYEIAQPDDLNDMSDTPLGSQLARPYDPNSLTARGGRVAEEVPYKGQGADQLDRLVKDSKWDKLKAAVKMKRNAADAKDLLKVFRDMTALSQEVDDETLYQKLKK